MGLITLTTDFGTADGYVGAMKGVIVSLAPETRVLDLTHEIPPQDVRSAAFALYRAVPYFPRGAVHCVVVDPGVGTPRRPLAVKVENEQYLVGPDSGVFTLFCPPFADADPEAVETSESRWWRDGAEPSSTFHGRDVFASVAAHLARMVASGPPDLSLFGPRVSGLARFEFPAPVEERGAYRGEVVHVDHFGNAVTNLPERWVDHAHGPVVVEAGGKSMPVVRTYSDVRVGELCGLVGSAGWLEVACRAGSAADRLGLGPGIPVVLRRR
ncbi:MAG TPA: SAM-dependent chlorinase/fluorinase [Gemmatimonadota bacterium]|jgi:S-adenosylmethionine hydrolase|nr:SAM-dependent chlorinase/fluorinase [Gemmatimonadota bacterium]